MQYNPGYYLNNSGITHLKNDLVINYFGDIGIEIQKNRYRGAVYNVEVFKNDEPISNKRTIPLKNILSQIDNFYFDAERDRYYSDKYEFIYYITDSGMRDNDDIRLIAIERKKDY